MLEGSVHMRQGFESHGGGWWTRLPDQETLCEAETKHQLPKAMFVCSNYWGVLHAMWEPKTCNYNVGQLFSAQEVGQVTPISKKLLLFMSQGPLRGFTSALAGSLVLDTAPCSKDPTSQGTTRLSCL